MQYLANFSTKADKWMLSTGRQYQEGQSLTEGLAQEQTQDTRI